MSTSLTLGTAANFSYSAVVNQLCTNLINLGAADIIADTNGLDFYDYIYYDGTNSAPDAAVYANGDVIRVVYGFKSKANPTC